MKAGSTAGWLRGGWVLVLLWACVVPLHAESAFVTREAGGPLRLTGTVSCSALVANRNYCRRNETPMSCTLRCADNGGQFVFVVEDKRFLLQGDVHRLRSFAGGRATVTGTAHLGVLNAESVEQTHK